MNSTPFLMKLSNKLILGSGSPRRKQLLLDAGFEFEVKTVAYEEVFPNEMKAMEVPEFLAKGKNLAQRKNLSDEIVLTADTVVINDHNVLGKPKDEREAIDTISALSGQSHIVVTGICISNNSKMVLFSCETEVKFKTLTKQEIEFYVTRFRPYDKAGSYAIQEWIGLIGVEWIKGSYYNVVGLPVCEVYQALVKHF